MPYKARFFPETRFGGFTHVDGSMNFFTRVNALLESGSVVLDVGCGRGDYVDDPVKARRDLRILRGKCRSLIGIDVDPAASVNPAIDEFRLIEGPAWPVAGDSIDLCLCDHVIEHVADPGAFFAECRRVIRPNGFLCIRTPNAFGYVAIAARLVPNGFHGKVLQFAQRGRQEQDVFATVYKCNTRRKLRNILAQNHFDSAVFTHDAEPAYLSFSKLAYRLGVAHQRYAIPCAKNVIFAFAQKQL
jgi:2-polyprenyl-3-methyl-5-hydroxy-6-metoxy-1,4-benzoquinol methylase